MKKLIQAQINEGEKLYSVATHVFDTFQMLFIHFYLDIPPECDSCGQVKTKDCRSYHYHNLAHFLSDREILEGMIE
ncbi:MAG: hypothetical protein IPI17_02160 [Nitrosomonas sp.]|nr:hypothetical protein [Nitrosomonas sp.]